VYGQNHFVIKFVIIKQTIAVAKPDKFDKEGDDFYLAARQDQ
jgi:hypothetical protein